MAGASSARWLASKTLMPRDLLSMSDPGQCDEWPSPRVMPVTGLSQQVCRFSPMCGPGTTVDAVRGLCLSLGYGDGDGASEQHRLTLVESRTTEPASGTDRRAGQHQIGDEETNELQQHHRRCQLEPCLRIG